MEIVVRKTRNFGSLDCRYLHIFDEDFEGVVYFFYIVGGLARNWNDPVICFKDSFNSKILANPKTIMILSLIVFNLLYLRALQPLCHTLNLLINKDRIRWIEVAFLALVLRFHQVQVLSKIHFR